MNSGDFLTANVLLSDILTSVGDENYRRGYSSGQYFLWIERALAELSYDTFYAKKTCDIKIDCKRLAIDLPPGIFNIREVYAFTPDKNGEFCNSVIVHHKRLYNNRGKGRSHTAKVKANQGNFNNDPYYGNNYNDGGTVGGYGTDCIYFYNVHGREMQLSSNLVDGPFDNNFTPCNPPCTPTCDRCANNRLGSGLFTHIRIVANATGVEKIGDAPIILRMLREAVIAWVAEQFFISETAKDRNFRVSANDWAQRRQVAFDAAERRIKAMDTMEKEDLYNYMSSLGLDDGY